MDFYVLEIGRSGSQVVAWLNGAVDDPEIVSIHKNLVSGTGGTNSTRFAAIFEIDGKTLLPGDEWDLRLRLTDGNSNADVLSAEGFGIDTVVLYGEPVVYVPPSDTKVIASYSFNTGSGASSDTETLTTAGAYSMAYYNSASPGTAEFTDMVNGLGLPSGTAASSIDRDSNPTLSDALNTTDFTAQTHLHQFTVTIPANATVSIDRIQFEWGVAETKHFNGLSPAFELVSDKTGSTILASDSFSIPSSVSSNIYSPDGAGVLKTYDIDLSGNTSLQNLSNTTVTFIIALDENANRDAAERRHVIDNVVLNSGVQGN